MPLHLFTVAVKNAGTSQSTELAKPPISSLHFITRSHSSTHNFSPSMTFFGRGLLSSASKLFRDSLPALPTGLKKGWGRELVFESGGARFLCDKYVYFANECSCMGAVEPDDDLGIQPNEHGSCNLAPVCCYTPIIAALYKQNRCLEVDEMCENAGKVAIAKTDVKSLFEIMQNEGHSSKLGDLSDHGKWNTVNRGSSISFGILDQMRMEKRDSAVSTGCIGMVWITMKLLYEMIRHILGMEEDGVFNMLQLVDLMARSKIKADLVLHIA
uniref:Uncharacterized protein n=1 Tax=Salix viminalis TaxID=40686 RepID=A0A6N2M4E6_SALVM